MMQSKTIVIFSALVLLLWPGSAGWAFESSSDVSAELKTALSEARDYRFGDSRAVLVNIDALVAQASAVPKLSREAEGLLLDCLNSKSSVDCKRYLCRKLQLIGSSASVPSLAALLTDPELAHMARYALENIPGKDATQALLDALKDVEGDLRLGIIYSLGARQDSIASPALADLLDSNVSSVVHATASALGNIGDTKAVEALTRKRNKATGTVRESITAACLQCADQFLSKGEASLASTIFKEVYEDGEESAFHGAALLGLGKSDPSSTHSLIMKALAHEDLSIRNAAITLVRDATGSNLSREIAASYGQVPERERSRLLGALVERGDPEARPAALSAMDSENIEIKIAGLRSLALFGEASDVPALLRLIVQGDEKEKQAARHALHRMRGNDVNSALVDAMTQAGKQEKLVVVESLAERHALETLDCVLSAARKDDSEVRIAALKALQSMAQEKHLGPLVDLLVGIESKEERAEAEKAVISSCKRLDDVDRGSRIVAAKFADIQDVPIKVSLLKVMGDVGGETAWGVLRHALRDPDPAIQDASLRGLMNWSDESPLEDLLRVAGETSNDTHRALALRGAIRMASQKTERDPRNGSPLLLEAHALAKGTDEIKLVLSGLRNAQDMEAFRVAASHLKEDALRSEAELATANIASHVASENGIEVAEVLEFILNSTKNEEVKQKTQTLLLDLRKNTGLITTWQIAGPFQLGNKKGHELFNIDFPAEKDGSKGIPWKPLPQGIQEDHIDLNLATGGGDHRVVYLRTLLLSPIEQNARLDIGSDDGIKVWVNGQLVHANNASRPLIPGEDKVLTPLKQGINTIFVKVTQSEGDWAFSLHVAKPDGSMLEDLTLSLDIPENQGFVLPGSGSTPLEFVGDYQGEWLLSTGSMGPLVAQVIGLSAGSYRVNLLDAFDLRTEDIAVINGFVSEKGVQLAGFAEKGALAGTQIEAILSDQEIKGTFVGDREGTFHLRKEIRLSPTLGAPPPQGAIVLFDGSNTDAWIHGENKPCRWRITEEGALEVVSRTGSIISKRQFKDQQIHVEFRTPYMPDMTGQARGNSGVYVMGRYEVQVLDSYGLYGHDNECGGIYKVAAPKVNMCSPPMQWQTYDITFHAPRFEGDGELKIPARITVLHNGVKIHDHVEILEATGAAESMELTDRGGIYLQDHGDRVQYRNIWVVEL